MTGFARTGAAAVANGMRLVSWIALIVLSLGVAGYAVGMY